MYFEGSGFGSKLSYGSGFFRMSLKLPGNNDTHGVLPTYYVSTNNITLYNWYYIYIYINIEFWSFFFCISDINYIYCL